MTNRRPRSTIVPGRILIPRMIYAQAGIRDDDSYLDEPTIRSQRSMRGSNRSMGSIRSITSRRSIASVVGSRRSMGSARSTGSLRRSRGREALDEMADDQPIFDDFDAPAPEFRSPRNVVDPEVDEMAEEVDDVVMEVRVKEEVEVVMAADDVEDENPPARPEVSFAIKNRPKRNRHPPTRWWLLERPKYDWDKGFIGMEKLSNYEDPAERSRKSTTTRKRAAKRSAPEKKSEKKSVKSKKSTTKKSAKKSTKKSDKSTVTKNTVKKARK